MSERIRGALFNALGDTSGLTVLDAFAGSGALSFEAVSRGAKHATAVEIDKNAANTIRLNAKNLGITNKVKVIRANASGWSDNEPDKKFDLLLIDPPFDAVRIDLINKLARHLNSDGILALALPGKSISPELIKLDELSNKNYGDAQLIFFKKKAAV